MTGLDQIRADVLDLHAYAERMWREARRATLPRADVLWMGGYVSGSGDAWRHVARRCYDLEAQIARQSAQQTQDGERVP